MGAAESGHRAKTNAGYDYLTLVGSTAATSAAATAPRASVAFQANEEQWENANITYNPSSKVLTATNQAKNERAEAQEAQVNELLESLPDTLRTKLLDKQFLIADVVVEQLGNQCTIKRILPPETG